MTNPCQGHAAESARADYKEEAKRLADAIVREVAELPDRDSPADWPAAMLVTSDELRGIVLAHIQRGAGPEGWRNAVQKLGNLTSFLAGWKLSESCIRNDMGTEVSRWIDGLSELYKLYAAPAPDNFRDAAVEKAWERFEAELQRGQVKNAAAEMVADTEDNGFGLLHDRPHTEMPGCRGAKSLKVRASADEPCDVVGHCVAETHCKTACKLRSSAPAEVPMPEPVAYGIGNTAITGHTNRLMMVRIVVPLDDQYAGAGWHPLVLADEMRTYGERCRAVGEAAGYARGVADERERICAAIKAEVDYCVIEVGYMLGPEDCISVARGTWKRPNLTALRGEVKP